MGGVAATDVSTDASLLFLLPESTESLIPRSQSTQLCVSLMAPFKTVGLTQNAPAAEGTTAAGAQIRRSDANCCEWLCIHRVIIPRINLTAYFYHTCSRGDEARDMNRRRARDDVGRGDRRVEENGSPVCHVALFVDVMMDCGCVINLGKLTNIVE